MNRASERDSELEPASSSSGHETCPPASLLRRIGEEDIPDETFAWLEPHIERCGHCQAVLQAWADTDRIRPVRPDIGDTTERPAAWSVFDKVPDIPGFRLIRELGRGGEGVVHLAEEQETQRLVALKFLPGGWLVDPDGRRRWLRQVRATAQFQHANVVRLYRIEETSSWYVMVLEYVAGGTLRDCGDEPARPEAAAVIVRKLASAVEQIHRAGVLHLDLKPSNVLLDGDGASDLASREPKISDFGIAMRTEGGKYDGRHVGGTPAYMAPEQAGFGIEPPGPSTDVYGLGAILFFLLTSKAPFEGGSTGEILGRVLSVTPEFTADAERRIDAGLRAICLKAMKKDPGERFATPAELAGALEGWLESQRLLTEARGRQAKPDRTRRNAVRGTIAACSVVTALYFAAGSGRPVSPDQAATTATMPMTRWIMELREVEANVFFGVRLERLIEATRVHTAALLAKSPGDAEELARTGILLKAMAGRFVSSKSNVLLGKVEDLLEPSRALLERSHALAPSNQETIRELALSEIAFGSVKPMDLAVSIEELEAIEKRNVSHLERSIGWIDKVTDERARVYLASVVLDRCRAQAAEGREKGVERFESIWNELHRKCESNWASLSNRAEIRMRFDLFHRRRFDPPRDISSMPPDQRLSLEREFIVSRLEPMIFGKFENDFDPAESDFAAAIAGAESTAAAFGLPPEFVASVVYEDLIRQVSVIGTWFRVRGQIDNARRVARRYVQVARVTRARYPHRFETLLALSEAYLQDWKNHLRADDPAAAEFSLRESLEMARQATQMVPGHVPARTILDDRESRLARFVSGQ